MRLGPPIARFVIVVLSIGHGTQKVVRLVRRATTGQDERDDDVAWNAPQARRHPYMSSASKTMVGR